jgi:hypothetical protein
MQISGRRLGYLDNVLEMRLREIDSSLDTGVDYINRDGVSVLAILHSYRLLSVRQHEYVNVAAAVCLNVDSSKTKVRSPPIG